MKKFLITFTINLTVAAPLSSTIQTIYDNHIKDESHSKTHSKTNNNFNNNQSVFWYDSTININKDDNKPFGDNFKLSSSQNNDSSYFDNVFLKSLKLDNNTHKLTSSIVNLQNKDSVTDLSDSTADLNDYKTMQSLISTKDSSKTAIQEGMAVLNRCYTSSLFNFNINGYIPSRDTFFNEYKPTTKLFMSSNNNLKQQMITTKRSSNDSLLSTKTNDMYLSFHWYGISMNMDDKILTNPIINFLNGVASTGNAILEGLQVPVIANKICIKNSISDEMFKDILSYVDADQSKKNTYFGSYDSEINFINTVIKTDFRNKVKPFQISDLINLLKKSMRYAKLFNKGIHKIPKVVEVVNRFFNKGCKNDISTSPIDSDISEVTNIGADLENEIVDCGAIADAEAGAEGIQLIPIIGQILSFLVTTGVIAFARTLATAYQTKMDPKNAVLQNNSIEGLIINPEKNRFNILNKALINFKGSVNVNWLQKINLSLIPNKPKIVPPAILLPTITSPIVSKTYNMLDGTTNDFSLQMQPSTWNQFVWGILKDNLDINKFFIKHNISNPDILLTNDDWKNIIEYMPSVSVDSDYVLILHIVNKKIIYNNLNLETGKTNIKYGDTPYSIETLVGTSITDSNLFINKFELQSLINSLSFINSHWLTKKIDGKTIPGIKDNVINNFGNFKTPGEWFYNNYFKELFWHCGLNEKEIISYLNKLLQKYNSDFFDFTQIMAMTNIKNNILNISSSMLNKT